MRAALAELRRRGVAFAVDGELQADAALVPAVAARKAPGERRWPARANVLVFPDLDAGNIAYKLTERLGRRARRGPAAAGARARRSTTCRAAARSTDIVDVMAVAARAGGSAARVAGVAHGRLDVMKVLVVGGGGREHALCWKLRQSPLLTELYCAPGNPGIAEVADLVPIAAEEIHQLADFAGDLGIDLTVVGPELPLTLGIADEFARPRPADLRPRRRPRPRSRASKVFAKEFMARHGIPTAEFAIAHDARRGARRRRSSFGFPVVLKADGLAAGKGVLIPRDEAELDAALDTFFDERRFGSSGDRVVVERCLVGEEISFMALSDGERVLPLAASRDYKRLGDGDTGPNTGGMGAHSPAGVLDARSRRRRSSSA